MPRLVYATRRSALALAQCRAFVAKLVAANAGLELVEEQIVTTGDKIQDRPLSEVGGKGLFVKEIEEALLERRADIAVHSLKDVPGELAPTLVIGCIPAREDPRDIVFTRTGCRFRELPPASKVGTSSLRRMTMLKALRPDLEYVPIRGNVDTRLRRVTEGAVDAVVLAYAGVRRLGLEDRVTEVLDPSECLPAVGQGALAIECRADDAETRELLRRLSHAETAIAVAAERGVMVAVEGSCQMPVAAYAVHDGASLWLRGMLAEPDGSGARFKEVRIAWPSAEKEATAAGVALGAELRGA
jgi:hydroxymethylbilane synthase